MSISKRGFGSMDAKRQREIASKGGKMAHAKGTAHQWTSEEAKAAGRKGGIVSRGGKGRTRLAPADAEPSPAPTASVFADTNLPTSGQ
jgi:general stress protein YciG